MAIEFALMGSSLVLLVMAATDLSLAIRARAEVGNAARAGAQYAAINCSSSCSSSAVATAVTSATPLAVTPTSTTYCGCATASGIAQQTCGTPCAAGGTTGTYVSASAAYSYTPLFPTQWNAYLVHNFVNMSATETTRTQ